MKLLTYHIENYGKIQNKDGAFAGGLTCFCEENGFGKTTLASFIKAIFYGLPKVTRSMKEFNDRKRFYPFNGGKFGGNITFELGGKVYKIERFFDQTSETRDELAVYCNGSPYEGFGAELGKEIFGLDEESFKKTVFITAEEIELGSTHSINEKLNRSVEKSGSEDGGYEDALEILEKAKKRLKAGRGSNDLISAKRAEILELQERIRNLTDMSESLSGYYTERERLLQEIAVLETESRKAGERSLLLQKWETFDGKSRQAQNAADGIAALEEKYPQGMPTDEERKSLAEAVQTANGLRGSLSVTAFGAEKEEKLRVLREKFSHGEPTDADLEALQGKIRRLDSLAEQAERETYEPSVKEKQLVAKFSLSEPSEAELEEKRALVEEYKKKDNELKALSQTLLTASQPERAKKTGKGVFIVFAVACLLCLAGCVLLFFHKLAGGVAIGVGVCVLVASIVGFKRSVNSTTPSSNVNMQLVSLQAEMRTLEEKIHAFTAKYGYYSTLGAVYDFGALESDLALYKECLSETEARKKRKEALWKERETLVAEIGGFLDAYGENTGEAQSGLTRLTLALRDYRALLADKVGAAEKEASSRARLERAEAQIAEILKRYALSDFVCTMDGLSALNHDCRAYGELVRAAKELQAELAEYKEKNGLAERPSEMETNADGLNERLSELRKALASCDKAIAETERETEKLADRETELTVAEEKLKEYKEKYDLLDDTAKALTSAEQALKDKYIAPIKERFSVYAEALEKVLGEKVEMDQDFRVVFERGGQTREDRHLSAGERSLCALCLRLALIDNMYGAEQPFIVMDDPFVHLDKIHLERTVKLLKELAQGKQIVYFCCHPSRAVE